MIRIKLKAFGKTIEDLYIEDNFPPPRYLLAYSKSLKKIMSYPFVANIEKDTLGLFDHVPLDQVKTGVFIWGGEVDIEKEEKLYIYHLEEMT